MTGPEHYREAERLISQVDEGAADWEPLAAAAQVHATLALAAATALRLRADGGDGYFPADAMAWRDATSMTATIPAITCRDCGSIRFTPVTNLIGDRMARCDRCGELHDEKELAS